MNSSYIWIFAPLLLSGILLLLRRWITIVAIIAATASVLLAVLAAWLPSQEQISLWRWVFPFSDTFLILGRRLVLSSSDRPAIIIIYLTAALWFGAVSLVRPTRLFVPLSMAIIALFTAAIAVEPFLFAAILIELAVLLSIPILAPPGKAPGRGILRYLTFQTLGMPFILIAGFLLAGLENSPGEPIYIAVAIASLAIGFALLLAVFPFYTWIPMLAEESHPYPTAFIFLLLPTGILLLGLNFLDTFTWLYENPNSEPLLQVVGAVMVVTAGIWAATEKNIARMMGFAVLLDIGFSLLAISLSLRSEDETYRILFFTGLVPRGLSLGVLALALSSLIGKTRSFELDDVRGLAKIYPVNSIAIVAAIFCFAGLPLLAGFPIKLGVIEGLSGQSPAIAIWVVLGAFGLLIGGIRASLVMVSEEAETLESLPISRVLVIFLVIGVVLLFLIGLLPNLLMRVITGFPGAFTSLG